MSFVGRKIRFLGRISILYIFLFFLFRNLLIFSAAVSRICSSIFRHLKFQLDFNAFDLDLQTFEHKGKWNRRSFVLYIRRQNRRNNSLNPLVKTKRSQRPAIHYLFFRPPFSPDLSLFMLKNFFNLLTFFSLHYLLYAFLTDFVTWKIYIYIYFWIFLHFSSGIVRASH